MKKTIQLSQEEINEGNKLIANLMGGVLEYRKDPAGYLWAVSQQEDPDMFFYYPKGVAANSTMLQFHESFDWIMEAVDHIESLGWNVRITRKAITIEITSETPQGKFFECVEFVEKYGDKKIAAFKAIVRFCEHWNKI